MRHDLLGADLQMFHFIKHRIEHDLLRAGANDDLNLFGALGRAAPNGNAWTEIGILVPFAEPLANAALAARFVVINGEINPLGEVKGRRVALRLV